MEYCNYCGGELRQIEDSSYECNSCSRTLFINPKASVAIVLYNENQEYIFGIRARDPEEGKLDCIGGFLNVGENHEEALFREMKEEANINSNDIEDLRYLCSTYDDYEWEETRVPTASVYFLAKLKSGVDLRPADDISRIIYKSLEEINFDDFAWNGMRIAFG